MNSMGNPFSIRRMGQAGVYSCVVLLVLVLTVLPAHAAERSLVTHVNPVCPEIVKRMHISGIVKMMVTVNAQGVVTDVKTVDGNRILATSAEQAVHKWKYATGEGADTFEVNVHFSEN